MKKVIYAATLALATVSAAHAGGYSEPVIEEIPVIEESGSSGSLGGNALLLLLGVAALAVALNSSDDTADEL
ncbi:hypothetical protein [Celeribacter arenosi]|uniref:Ferrochelatase n=1 Tax=Celeribacter arenosi TaxID=792649 RepID=A0ABP7K0F1_9RHOB